MNFLKSKAVFMVFVLVLSIFSISLLNIEDVNAENNVCCEKTTDGKSCVFTDEINCAAGYNKASTACESTNFCKVGCCYSLDEGVCSKNTPRAVCEDDEGIFNENANCEIPQCQNGCCQLPGQCSFVSYAECRASVGAYSSLNFQDVFDSDIQDEITCSNQCRSSEEGCCITDDGAKFVTRAECVDINGKFNLNMLCSNPKLGTGCTKEHNTGCLPDKDEIYWFDSCNNRETIYGVPYTGFVNDDYVSGDDDIRGNVKNVNYGGCDYTKSSICAEADDNFLGELRQAGKDTNRIKNMCIDLTCKSEAMYKPDTIDFKNELWRLDQDKQNGESWCVYDGVTGSGMDLVGSRHYRHVCLNGKEVFEECANDREEICVQNDIELSDNQKITGALCKPNRWQECLKLNEVDYSYSECNNAGKSGGFDCSNEGNNCKIYKDVDKDKEYENCCKEQCNRKNKCEEFPSDCYWHLGLGVCAPNVPTSSTDNCDAGTVECKQVWVKGGTFDDWTVKYGKDCNTAEWAANINSFCRSLGDCGAHYNIKGELSLDGFSFTGPNENVEDFWKGKVVSSNAEIFTKDNIGGFNRFNKALEPIIGKDVFGLWALLLAVSKYGDKPPKSFWQDWRGRLTAYGLVAGGITGLSLEAGVGTWSSIWEGLSLTTGGHDLFGILGAPGTTIVTMGAGSAIPAGTAFTATAPTVLTVGTQTLTVSAGETVILPSSATITTGTGTTGAGAALGSILSVIAIGAVIILVLYFIHILGYKTKTITYTAKCYPWVAPTGGDKCNLCKEDFKICDEYRCKSLGQNCELINQGTPDQDCVAVNVNDASPPVIDLLPIAPKIITDFTKTRDGYIFNENIPVYTSVNIGINTNEPSQCKITKNPTQEYDDISEYFGTTLSLEEHRMTINVASEELNENSLDIFGGGEYTYYARCQDKNGNKNRAGYYIRFIVNDEPDKQPPVVESMSLEDNTPIAYGAGETELLLELNEPGYCRFAKEDLDYELMGGETECPIASRSNPYKYPCKMTLSDIEDNKLNNYYIRCKDKAQPEPNINQESKILKLRGTQPLEISSISPTGTLYTFNVTLKLETSKGANNGKATCYYNTNQNMNNKIEFLNTDSNVHTQSLILDNGEYNYYFLCKDEAGNQDKGDVTFTVDTPEIKIVDVEPRNGNVIRGKSFEITVVTEGKAEGTNVECSYEIGGLSGVLFFEEQNNKVVHKREITGLNTGNYRLNIECSDGYKTTKSYTEFRIDITTGPMLIRIYTTQSLLNILLNQEAVCEYSDKEFSFGDGSKMVPEENSKEKSAVLGQDVYYIKCRNNLGLEGSFIIYP
jgi:hypothetical protein